MKPRGLTTRDVLREGLTRREIFKLAGAGAAAMFVACGDNEGSRDPGNDPASMVLEPDTTAFIVLAWSSVAKSAALEVQSGDTLVLATTIAIDRDGGFGSLDVTGLAPSTAYDITLFFETGVKIVHHARTAPAVDDTRPVRIAVSADIDPSPEFDTPLFTHLAAANPEVFVSIGDFPYADNGPALAMTVPEYRDRHLGTLTTPKLRHWLQAMAVRAIYDDHEFRNNWDAMFVAAEPARYAAAIQVWDEFFPVRGATGEVRYRSWRWGAHVDCILLDCRRFRSADAAPDDDTKTMLGDPQEAWLIDTVKSSTATFKLIFTSVPLDYGDGNDHWATFTTQRNRIFDALLGVPGVLWIAGDQHLFAAHEHMYGIREFQIGPLCRGIGNPMRTAPGVLYRNQVYNFGLIDVEGDQLTFSGVGPDGEVFYKETLTPQMLTAVL